jgi:hypothetical protein
LRGRRQQEEGFIIPTYQHGILVHQQTTICCDKPVLLDPTTTNLLPIPQSNLRQTVLHIRFADNSSNKIHYKLRLPPLMSGCLKNMLSEKLN